MSALDSWENFFRSCELPSNICRIYAKSFVKERIQPFMLKELGKEELKELGISALGDQLSILRYLKSSKGILHNFNNSKNRSIFDDNDFIGDDFSSRIRDFNVGQNLKIQTLNKKKNNKAGAFFSTKIDPRRVSEQSRIIRKKPVMIQDISSSSPFPLTGLMRSDSISLKTMVVNSNRNKPNFRVNLNSSNAYIDDESLYEDNNYDDYIELPQPKTSRNIILSNRNMSNVSTHRSGLISNINKATTSSAIRNIVLSNDNYHKKKLASMGMSNNNRPVNRSIQSRIQILKPKVSENIMNRISILKH